MADLSMSEQEYTDRVDECRRELYFCARSILRNDADAEDAVSNAILRGFENLRQLKEFSKFKSWMRTITKNEALKILKKRMELPGDEALEAMLAPVEDRYDELSDVIQKLSTEYKKVIVLFYYDNLSIKEIAEVLEIPEGTVKSRLSRGKKALKKALDGREELLKDLQKKESAGKKKFMGIFMLVLMLAALMGGVLLIDTRDADASFWGHFTQKIRSYFGISKEEAQEKGIESSDNKAVSKQDLMLEMYEQVMDEKNIYLLVKITAPPEIEFSDEIGFDYFAFCESENYNAEKLIGGATDCKLQQTLEDKKNVATYVVSLSGTKDLKENTNVTVSFKDLTRDPYGDAPELLVEGMWSLTFPINFTVKDKISIEGTDEMTYPFVKKTARLKQVKMTALGLTLVSDVSEVPNDELGVSDTSLSVRLKMIDGTEKIVASHDLEEKTIVNGGGNDFEMKKKQTIMTNSYEFSKKISVNEVLGVYVEDLYISFISV